MQRQAQSSPAQEWDASRYAENARFVSELGQPLLELLNPQSGECILDLGCGVGALTEKLVAIGAQVVGVDASEAMVAASRRRGLDAHVVDAYQLEFNSEFDAVFSNAALHWMKLDPDAVISGVYRSLKPGGRFVAELGGFGNVAAIAVALCARLAQSGVQNPAALLPWYFPTAEEYRNRLQGAGFKVEYIELIPRPTPLPTGMRGWLETFAVPILRTIPEENHGAFLADVCEKLRPALCDHRGVWTADYVRLRFLAKKAR
jgi:trans-aconitate methyltransferase